MNSSKPTPSSTLPDWSREKPRRLFDPSRRLIRAIRKYEVWQNPTGFGKVLAPLMRRRWAISHLFWSVITAAEIPLNCQIEGGLILPHPSGVVVHPEARIGPNCLLGAHVVVGVGKIPGTPSLVGHVTVHAGACILGGIEIGQHTQVGANAVVIDNIPAFSTAVGVPAKPKPRKDLPDDVMLPTSQKHNP